MPSCVLYRVAGTVFCDFCEANKAQQRSKRQQSITTHRDDRQKEQSRTDADVLQDARHRKHLYRGTENVSPEVKIGVEPTNVLLRSHPTVRESSRGSLSMFSNGFAENKFTVCADDIR